MTRATITIEIEIDVTGDWVRAEPDVGIMFGFYEVNGFDHNGGKGIDWTKIEEQYSEEIQEALADGTAAAADEAADARRDAIRDRQGEE